MSIVYYFLSLLFFCSIVFGNIVENTVYYQLVVYPKNDIKSTLESLKKLGFEKCKLEDKVFICSTSSDINYIQRLKDFLSERGINAKVRMVNSDEINKDKNLEENKLEESKEVKVIESKTQNKQKTKEENKLGNLVEDMYSYLNSNNLEKAKSIANHLISTKYRNHALYVLGLVNLKKESFKEACEIFTEIKGQFKDVDDLINESCYVYYMKLGYEYLDKNPKKSVTFFQKSLSYKDNIESKVGLYYAYSKFDFPEAEKIIKELYEKYPDNKEVLKAYRLYTLEKQNKSLKTVLNMIKNKNYEEAESLLKDLYDKNPSNIGVLLMLGYLYLEKGDIDKAENFYSNVLLLDENNVDALKGLKAVYIKKGNYEKALELSKKLQSLGEKDKDYKKVYALYLIQKAQEFLKEKKYDLAYDTLKEALELDKNNPQLYLILAEIYKSRGDDKEYFKNISKAYSLDPNNFNIKVAFIYGLLNLNLLEQAKNLIESIAKSNLDEDQKKELKNIYKVFYHKLASTKLDQKDYVSAKKIAQEGLKFFPNDPDLMEVYGWACYNLKDYKCSESTFKYLESIKDDESIKLGLAYTYLNFRDYSKLKYYLNLLSNSTDKKILKSVAEIYAIIGDYKQAKAVINKIDSIDTNTKPVESLNSQPTLEKLKELKIKEKTILPDIFNNKEDENIKEIININIKENSYESEKFPENEKEDLLVGKNTKETFKSENSDSDIENLKKQIEEKEQDYISNVYIGVKYRQKSGESGKSKLTDVSPFLKYVYYLNPNLYLYFGSYFTSLNSGELSDYLNYGSPYLGTILRKVPSSYSGIEPFGGFSLSSEKVMLEGKLGLTPKVNNNLSSKMVGFLEGKVVNEDKKFGLGLYQEPIRDSLLSYVGSIDPYSLKSWGRAYENGIKISGEKKLGEKDSLIYGEAKIGKISGDFVEENTDINVLVMPKIYSGRIIGDEDYLGAFILYNSYSKKQDCFYFGCGGYFSPKTLFILAPMIEGFKFFDEKNGLYYKIIAGLLHWNDGSNTNNDITFDGYLGYSYLINKNLMFNVAAEYRKTQKYSEFFLSGYINYFFGNRVSVTKQDLIKLNKEIYK